jgi:uncharacterized membrane protein YccC
MRTRQRRNGGSPKNPSSRMSHVAGSAAILAVACLLSYWLITTILTLDSVSRCDDLLGGMWATVATIFVYRQTYDQSARAAFSRILATLLSFVLCLIYLLIFPFHVVGMAVLIGVMAIILALVRRPEEIMTATITTAVVMVVAGMSPEKAWLQPILRLVDTSVGIVVGVAASWISLRLGLSPSLERSKAKRMPTFKRRWA